MPDPINIIDPSSRINQPQPIEIPQSNPPVSNDTADTRATKASYGLSQLTGKSKDDMQRDITAGKEPKLRQDAANKVDQYNEYKRTTAIGTAFNENRAPSPDLFQPVPKADPSTVFERAYANAFAAPLFDRNDPYLKYLDTISLHDEAPKQVDSLHYFTKEVMAKNEYLANKIQGTEDAIGNQSYVGYGVDQVLGLFQPYNELRLRGRTEDAGNFASLLLGSDLKKQAEEINAEPTLEGFKQKLDAAADGLKSNPTLQHHFLSYIANQENPTWDNLFTAGMVSGVAAKVAGKLLRFTNIARDFTEAAKVVSSPKDDPALAFWKDGGEKYGPPPNVAVNIAKGDVKEAAIQTVQNDIKKGVAGLSNPTARAVQAISTGFRQLRDKVGLATNRGMDLAERINQAMYGRQQGLIDLLGPDNGEGQLRVNRISDISENPEAVRAVEQRIQRQFPEWSGNVQNMEGFYRDTVTNHWYVEMVLGRNDGSLHASPEAAAAWAKEAGLSLDETEYEGYKTSTYKVGNQTMTARYMPPGGKRRPFTNFGAAYIGEKAKVGQEGGGYYLAVPIPVNETEPIIRQFYGSTPDTVAPWSIVKAWTSWIQTPENTMSVDQRAQRLIATEGPASFYSAVASDLKELKSLSKNEANELDRVIKSGQQRYNDKTGKQGYFFTAPGELDDEWQRTIGHPPSDNQIAAYWEFVGHMESDYWMREVSVQRNMYRTGAMEWEASVKMPDGKMLKSPKFHGNRIDKLPTGENDVIAFINKTHSGNSNVPYAWVKPAHGGKALQGAARQNVIDDIEKGYARVIHVYDSDLNQLGNFGAIGPKDRVTHVVSYNANFKPISWGNIARTEGGHFDREYTHYISQARVHNNNPLGKHIYLGDTNLLGVMSEAEAKRMAPVLDRLREFKVLGDEQGARNYYQQNVIGKVDFNEFWKKFEPSRDINGNEVPPVLNLNEPIQWRPKDKNLMDLGKDALENRYVDANGRINLIDGTRQGNQARSSAIQYTGERDSYDFFGARAEGTKYNPVFNTIEDQLIDGIPMMNRGLGRIINSLFMDDYKITGVNHWLFGGMAPSREGKMVGASNWIDADPQEIQHAPFYHFHFPKWKTGTPAEVKSALEADAMKIKAFIGVPSKIDTFLHSMEQKITDSMFNKFGPKALKLTPFWKLSALSNGPQFMRSAVMNTKMGFFSPRQFFIHFFTVINGMLIAPKYATAGAQAAIFHGLSTLNRHPDIMRTMDQKISSFSFPGHSKWLPGQFKEAQDAMLKTGFQHVDLNQLALKDNPMANNIIKNKTSAFLDAGMSPFRAGVKSLKTMSWYMAYKEFRDLHPTGPLRDADLEKILLRANDFTHNMSRASTSALQKGMLTFGAQFSSYNLRLAELLIGKRLSYAERARLFGGYATIFGIPTAGGIIGLSTIMRDQVDKGNVPGMTEYVPGHDFVRTALMEGLIPAIGNEATGHTVNLGESYGAKDLEVVERSLDGDTTLWDFFGGATYSTLANTWANSSPFRLAMMNMIKGEGPYTVTANDWARMLSEISSANYAYRTYMAFQTGKFMSKNGAYLSPASPEYALFSGITGLTDQSTADLFRTSQLIKDRRAGEAQTFKEYARVMQQYFQAMHDNNQGQAETLGKNASILLQAMPPTERGRAVAQAYQNNQSLVDRINWQWANDRSVKPEEKQRLQNILQKQQEVKQRQQ